MSFIRTAVVFSRDTRSEICVYRSIARSYVRICDSVRTRLFSRWKRYVSYRCVADSRTGRKTYRRFISVLPVQSRLRFGGGGGMFRGYDQRDNRHCLFIFPTKKRQRAIQNKRNKLFCPQNRIYGFPDYFVRSASPDCKSVRQFYDH